MSDLVDTLALSLPEAEALSLTEVALALDQARGANDPHAMAVALERNLQLWTAIKTLTTQPDSRIPREIAVNLTRLADFVAATILKAGTQIGQELVNTLVNINFQISEGLLEGSRRKAS
ncbi:MAG: flagellar biosynthesis regulator FlaF [Magnetospirillum sp.]|nr:flagellar biosynthesis regulator FlaF [Magnetospirillum sp.]